MVEIEDVPEIVSLHKPWLKGNRFMLARDKEVISEY